MTYNRVMWIVLCALLIVVIGLMVRRQAALPAPTTRLGGLRVAPQAAETQSPTEVLANAAAVASGPHITISISADAPAQIIIATPTALQATETPTMAPSATSWPTAQQDPSATATQRPSDTPTSTISSTSTPTTAPSATAISTATRTATPTPVAAGVFAFPGAEGFGAVAVGGRGGRVYPVTSLADSGAGTLRECVAASGPRICVFRTGGTIELASTLTIANPYITIAGQTAPGDGITLKLKDPSRSIDMLKITTYEVIIRYIRSRPGPKGADARALTINAGGSVPQDRVAHNIVIDHMSMSWAGDEILIAWDRTHDVTFSWNILAESLTPGLKGPNLGKYGGGNYSFHHNLVAHHVYRLPNISTSGGPTDLVNNVIYNYKTFGARVLLGAMVNIVGNYIEAGPDTQAGSYYVRNDLDVPDPDSNVPLPNPDTRGFFVAYNLLQPNYGGSLRIRDILPPNTKAADIHEHRYLAPQVTTTTAQEAYTEVLANAGAVHGLACDGTWVARPDAVDRRIVESVRLKRSSHNTLPVQTGYISDPSEVGGWPVLAAGSPCPDADNDGMPNLFESRMGYNLSVNDSAVVEPNGYTRMDIFLGGLP